jgi:hypothetical protein
MAMTIKKSLVETPLDVNDTVPECGVPRNIMPTVESTRPDV